MKKRRIRVTLGVTINAGNYQNYRPEVEASAQLERGEDEDRAYRRLSNEAFNALVANTMGLMTNQPDWQVRDALDQIGVIPAEQDELLLKRAAERAELEAERAAKQTEAALVQGDDGVVASSDEVYDECADCGDPADSSEFDDYDEEEDEDDFDPDDEEEVERDDFGGELEVTNVPAQEVEGPVTDVDTDFDQVIALNEA